MHFLLIPFLIFSFALHADTFTIQQTLTPSLPGIPGIGDGFGQTVKIYDKWLFVASPEASPDGKTGQGAIYVYRKRDNTWLNTQIITTNGISDHLGDFQIEMHDKWLFLSAVGTPIGANQDDVALHQDFTGAVLIYRYDPLDRLWKFSQSIDRTTPGLSELTPASPPTIPQDPASPPSQDQQGACFGLRFGVDLKSKIMLVGAQFQQGVDVAGCPIKNSGAVYAFKLNEKGQWVFTQKITNPDGMAADDVFGANIAIRGRLALISNAGIFNRPRLGSNSFVYVFFCENGQWSLLQKLSGDQENPTPISSPTLGNITVGDAFGSSLTIDNRWAIIGAALETKDAGGLLSGAAYFYKIGKVDGIKQLIRMQKVYSDDPTSQGTAFLHVALQGDTALISDPMRQGPAGQSQGGIMVFRFKEDTWQHISTLYDPNGQPFGFFGVGVSKFDKHYVGGDGATIAGQFFSTIGNPVITSPALSAGDAVIFTRQPEPINAPVSSPLNLNETQ